jgi:hypothetical protein
VIRVIKITYRSKKGEFPSGHATTKNVTKLAWWLCEAISKNTTNQGNRTEGIDVLFVDLKRAAWEVLYLRWCLCGDLISDGAAEIVMVGEC